MKKFLYVPIAAAMSMVFAVTAYADVLGTVTDSWVTNMGGGTSLHGVTYESGQTSVGKQSEYYAEYTPNSDATPVVVSGATLWNTRTINGAANYMKRNNLRPLMAINGDYFSYTTGIPMGAAITDGEIMTADAGYIDAVGFRSDGTGFIKGLDIETTVTDITNKKSPANVMNEENSASIGCINKWYRSDYTPIGLITDKFGEGTKTNSDCLFLLCTPTAGKLSLGTKLTLNVDDKFEYEGDVTIPDGKMVLVINREGNEGDYNFMNSVAVGDSLEIDPEAAGDDEGYWKTAENAIGTSAGRLITNGKVGSGFEEGAAPRTAIGVKDDGTIVFYVLDGRQSGYSYGARAETIANRLLEMGCTNALNLDGGGSTAMAAVFPGSDEWQVINSPSDGTPRSCANYIFLRDNRKPSGIPQYVTMNNAANKNFISGSSTRMNITSIYDSSNYKMDSLENAHFEVNNSEGSTTYMDDDNVLHFEGTGKATVDLMTENGRIYEETYQTYETPQDIRVVNEDNGITLDPINCKDGDTVRLAAIPIVNGIELNSYDKSFKWSVSGNIGTVNDEGTFTAAETDPTGTLNITAGGFTKAIKVIFSDYVYPFADISTHWAGDIIAKLSQKNIINGYDAETGRVFLPDKNITRAEFAQIICNYLAIDTSTYAKDDLPFADASSIAPWAVNAIKAAYVCGIISGGKNSDGTYSYYPEKYITRAEAFTILGRVTDSGTSAEMTFADNSSVPQWAAEYVKKLLGKGIIHGYADNTILPLNNVTRAEAASLIYSSISAGK